MVIVAADVLTVQRVRQLYEYLTRYAVSATFF